jgi:hypothetical protein
VKHVAELSGNVFYSLLGGPTLGLWFKARFTVFSEWPVLSAMSF